MGRCEEEWRDPLDGARFLAEESGGFAVVNTNSLEAGFDRIVRENSAYYLIGYYSANELTDGNFAAEIRSIGGARRSCIGPAIVPPRTAAAATAPAVREQLPEFARSPLPVSGMTMHLAAAPFLAPMARRASQYCRNAG